MTKKRDVTVTPETGHVELTGRATRQPISMRLRDGQRDRVWGQAAMEGKSLNEMVCDLIDRGLEADRQQAHIYGSVAGFAVARALLGAAEAAVAKYGADQGLWLYDLENFERAVDAMQRMLETLRPVPETQEALAQVEAARQRHLKVVRKEA